MSTSDEPTTAAPTREVELKAIVEDMRAARRAIEAKGARLVFSGRLEDRRYDAPFVLKHLLPS